MKKFIVCLSIIILMGSVFVSPVLAQRQVNEKEEINFTVTKDSEIVFIRTFIYGIPEKNHTPFYGEKYVILINGQQWSMLKDGRIVSPNGSTKIQKGSEVKILCEEQLGFLKTFARQWAKSLYTVFEIRPVSHPIIFPPQEKIV